MWLQIMWLRARLYLLVGLLFAILYGIIAFIGYLAGAGSNFYIFLLIFAFLLIYIQYMIGPKTVEWSMKIRYVDDADDPKLHSIV